MTKDNFKSIYNKLRKPISPFEDPFESYPKNQKRFKKSIINSLNNSLNERDVISLEILLSIGFNDGYDDDYSTILCNLLESKWHELHEDIIMALDSIGDPNTVKCIANVLDMQLAYLEYDKTYSLEKKCIWALSSIDTQESWSIIENFSKSDNQVLRNFTLQTIENKDSDHR